MPPRRDSIAPILDARHQIPPPARSHASGGELRKPEPTNLGFPKNEATSPQRAPGSRRSEGRLHFLQVTSKRNLCVLAPWREGFSIPHVQSYNLEEGRRE